MKNPSKLGSMKHRPVKSLSFVGSVAPKGGEKPSVSTSTPPEVAKRRGKLLKVVEPPDTHKNEHQMSNYLKYER